MYISDADFKCLFRMRISDAERNGENRPLFPAAPHGNFPSEPLCHLSCDGKSKSKAPILTPAALVASIEPVKHMRKILLRNAASEILNREHGIFLPAISERRTRPPSGSYFNAFSRRLLTMRRRSSSLLQSMQDSGSFVSSATFFSYASDSSSRAAFHNKYVQSSLLPASSSGFFLRLLPPGFFPSLCYFTQNSESKLKRFDFEPRAESKLFWRGRNQRG